MCWHSLQLSGKIKSGTVELARTLGLRTNSETPRRISSALSVYLKFVAVARSIRVGSERENRQDGKVYPDTPPPCQFDFLVTECPNSMAQSAASMEPQLKVVGECLLFVDDERASDKHSL